MRSLRSISAALVAAVLFGCGGSDSTGTTTPPPPPPPNTTVTSIVLSPSSVPALLVGATTTLSATAKNSAGVDVTSSATFTWTTSDATVATVSGGLVTAKGAGTATIAAAVGTVNASVTVTVTPPAPAAVKTINVTLASASIVAGATTQASAVVLAWVGNQLTGRTVTGTSPATGVATVTSSGVVAGVAAGTSTITATNGTVNGTATVTVTAAVGGTNGETFATLPQVFLNTTAPPAPDAGGQIISATSSAAFQTALNSANYGDVIELSNGVTYTGNFTLPAKGANNGKWITIRPATRTGMPAENARMTPTLAASVNLPIILSANNGGAIVTVNNSHHYRLIGLEISVTSNNPGNTGLVRFGDGGGGGQTSLAVMPNNLGIVRCYIHGIAGTPGVVPNTRRAVALNSASSAVIDSYISEIHEQSADAQAIAGWNGAGPYKIVNNYLEASSENVSFGGPDPGMTKLNPQDLAIRANHSFIQVSWKNKWLVKNLFESKASARVLVEGNLMENNWLDGQGGSAINLKSTNQSGGCPGCGTMDVTFRYNLIKNTGSGIVVSANPDPNQVNFKLQRITFYDNIIANIDVAPTFTGDGRGILINQDIIDVSFIHNTIINPSNAAVLFGGPQTTPPLRLSIRDNIIGGGAFGVKGPGLVSGSPSITAFMPAANFVANVLVLASSSGYPSTSFYATSVGSVGFVDLTNLDLHLTASSSFKSKATDGKDPGANVDLINAAIAGVIVP